VREIEKLLAAEEALPHVLHVALHERLGRSCRLRSIRTERRNVFG
jgi:hypothetical protein